MYVLENTPCILLLKPKLSSSPPSSWTNNCIVVLYSYKAQSVAMKDPVMISHNFRGQVIHKTQTILSSLTTHENGYSC